MERSEIERLIDEKILEHERRIGWISGIAGTIFIAIVLFLCRWANIGVDKAQLLQWLRRKLTFLMTKQNCAMG